MTGQRPPEDLPHPDQLQGAAMDLEFCNDQRVQIDQLHKENTELRELLIEL